MQKGDILIDKQNLKHRYDGICFHYKTEEKFLIITLIDFRATLCGTKFLYDEKTVKEMFTPLEKVDRITWCPVYLPYDHCKKCKYGVEGDCYEDASCVKWGLKEGRNFSFRKNCCWFEKRE